MAREQTLLEYVNSRVGLFRATKVASFIVAWGIYSEKSGDDPLSVKGYAAYWRMSLANAYKERDVFRIAFPDDQTPDRLWSLFRAGYRAKVAESRRADKLSAQLLSMRGDFSGG